MRQNLVAKPDESDILNRISQPLLDRIDICVETPQIKFEELNGTKKEECSDTIRERVIEVHAIQKKRYQKEDFQFNSQIPAECIGKRNRVELQFCFHTVFYQTQVRYN